MCKVNIPKVPEIRNYGILKMKHTTISLYNLLAILLSCRVYYSRALSSFSFLLVFA